MKYKLGDICEIVSGSTPKTSIPEYWDGDKKWITPAEINEESYIITDSARKLTELGVKKTGLSPFPEGTVILSSRAPIGKVAIAGCEMYCNQGFKNLICSEKINNRYLYWFLKGNTEFLNSLSRGATFKEVSKQIVSNIEINVPSIAQQEQAAIQLETANAIIRFRKQQLQKLDELVKARFVELFGDESNPYNFPIVTIEDVASVQVGVVIKPAQYYTDAGHGIKTFRSLNIGPMHIKDTDWVYFSEEGNRKNQKSVLNENDLVIVRSGAPGTACVITKEYAGCNAVDIIIARPDLDKVNPYYLCQYTNLPHGKKQIEEGTGGAAQQHFNVGKYNKIRLTLPPLDQQLKFEKFVEQTDKSKLAIQQSLDKLKTLRKSLMQEYYGQGE